MHLKHNKNVKALFTQLSRKAFVFNSVLTGCGEQKAKIRNTFS